MLMDSNQRDIIVSARKAGLTYRQIAEQVGLPMNTVKTYLRRTAEVEKPVTQCKQCAANVKQNPKRKEKLFCSDKCRLVWWRAHSDASKSLVERQCPCCGKTFSARRSQIYCQHACYIKTRFPVEQQAHAAI